MIGNKEGEFLGLTPKASFIAGLAGGILILCTIGFFVLLTSMLQGNDLFAGKKVAANNPIPSVLPSNDPSTTPSGTPAPITESDHVLGDSNAKVTLIEYSDFECPYCKQFHPTVERLMQEYEGRVKWVYRHYPLSFHANAQKQAEASECVAELGGNEKFWQFAGTLFERTASGGTGFALADLGGLAQEIGVDKAKFQTCLDSGKYAELVNSHEQDGVQAGVSGTPGTVVMNEAGQMQLIPGAVSYDQLKQTVDALLQ